MDPSEAELQAHIFGRIHTSNAEKLGRKSHTPLSNSLASIALSSESDVIKIEVDQIEEKLKPNDVHSSKLDRSMFLIHFIHFVFNIIFFDSLRNIG